MFGSWINFKFIRHRGRVCFDLVRKWDERHIKPLPQTPAGSELAARSPAKALGGSKFLIPWYPLLYLFICLCFNRWKNPILRNKFSKEYVFDGLLLILG